jgi:hypothetical protein
MGFVLEEDAERLEQELAQACLERDSARNVLARAIEHERLANMRATEWEEARDAAQEVANRETLSAAYWKDRADAFEALHVAALSATGASLARDILAVCHLRGWSLHWTHRGAYLHLEASELIEALRGKRGDPLHEAADVLLVLMSITENAGIQWDSVMQKARITCDDLRTRPRYAGEEFDGGATDKVAKREGP